MNSLASFLMKVEPFSRLPLPEVVRLSLQSQVVNHSKGEVIYNEGENAAHVWVLQEGRLEIFKYSSEGRPLAIESIQARQLYGTLCRLGSAAAATYPCTAIAAMDSVSVRISDQLFNTLYHRYPAMVSSACQLCSLRLNTMQDRAASSQEPVQTRILKTLFQLRKNDGNELTLTRREISELSGTTVETTIRVLSEFRKKRWISSTRGKITLQAIPQLKALMEDSPRMADTRVMSQLAVA